MAPPFIRRVQIENFRSIASCDVELGPLMFIVGRNGSGKSNFLDALHFIADALQGTLEKALGARGGHSEVRRRQGQGRPFDIRIQLWANLPGNTGGEYRLIIGPAGTGYKIKEEYCRVGSSEFRVDDGKVTGIPNPPLHSPESLYLEIVSGIPPFGGLYKQLKAMSFFNLVPDSMRKLVPIGGRDQMAPDGENIAAFVKQIKDKSAGQKARIEAYLTSILPGLKNVEYKAIEGLATLAFHQNGWSFNAKQMSDGTLRALGVLAAVLGGREAPLVGLEEPEIALHPAAFGILRDALREGSSERQILATSQSPELLDDSQIDPKQILAVRWDNGQSRIGPIPEAEASMLRDQLMTAGELLHQGRLEPEPAITPA